MRYRIFHVDRSHTETVEAESMEEAKQKILKKHSGQLRVYIIPDVGEWVEDASS